MDKEKSELFVEELALAVLQITEKLDIKESRAIQMLADSLRYSPRQVRNWLRGETPWNMDKALLQINEATRKIIGSKTEDNIMANEEKEKTVEADNPFSLGIIIGEMKAEIERMKKDIELLNKRNAAMEAIYRNS